MESRKKQGKYRKFEWNPEKNRKNIGNLNGTQKKTGKI